MATLKELRETAKAYGIKGRSKMSSYELEKAIRERKQAEKETQLVSQLETAHINYFITGKTYIMKSIDGNFSFPFEVTTRNALNEITIAFDNYRIEENNSFVKTGCYSIEGTEVKIIDGIEHISYPHVYNSKTGEYMTFTAKPAEAPAPAATEQQAQPEAPASAPETTPETTEQTKAQKPKNADDAQELLKSAETAEQITAILQNCTKHILWKLADYECIHYEDFSKPPIYITKPEIIKDMTKIFVKRLNAIHAEKECKIHIYAVNRPYITFNGKTRLINAWSLNYLDSKRKSTPEQTSAFLAFVENLEAKHKATKAQAPASTPETFKINPDLAPDFDETAYTPERQDNLAVLDDIPADHEPDNYHAVFVAGMDAPEWRMRVDKPLTPTNPQTEHQSAPAEPATVSKTAPKPATRKPRHAKKLDTSRQIFIQFDEPENTPVPVSTPAKPKTRRTRTPRIKRDYSRQILIDFGKDIPNCQNNKRIAA